MRTIKAAAACLSTRYGTNHPLAVRGLQTDGVRIFDAAEGKLGGAVYEELGRYQFVIGEGARPFFRQLEYEDDMARYIWPLGRGKVVLDPARGFGKPIDFASGVPTYVLYQMRLAGESPERIARWYTVAVEAVNHAIEYESQLAA